MNVSAHRSVSNRLVRFGGVLATRRGKASARLRPTTAALALSVIALLTLCGGVAEATVSGLAGNGNFHAQGASGIAVDQSSGDVFTSGLVGSGEQGLQVGRNEKFDGAGNVLSPPSPFGAEELHYGAAVNPTNGHLYVASAFGEIEVYDPNTGEKLSSFIVPPFFTGATGIFKEIYGTNEVQLATDAAGDVYVPNVPENEILKYTETGTLLETITGSGTHALRGPRGVAVDSAGDVWVGDSGSNRIEELSPTGVFLGEFESEGVTALALDGHGDVLAIVNNNADDCGAIPPPCEHLMEYSETGAKLADVGTGYFGSPNERAAGISPQESMVAVDDASGRVYVTDGAKDDVWVYQPPTAPTIGQESAVEVGITEAKLGALVQPGGIQATYRLEYDTREYKENEGPHGVSVPYPEGSAGEGFSSRAVWASAKDLSPGTTYYYRAVATNGLGSVAGPDQTFTTVAAAQATCPNEAERSGASAGLPECRTYELVTPPGKSSAQPDVKVEKQSNEEESNEYPGGLSDNMAAGDGDRFGYTSAEVMPGAQSPGLEFIATRGPNGWSSEDALPLRPYTGDRCTFPVSTQTEVVKYSTELTRAIVVDNSTTTGEHSSEFSEECRGETVEVVSDEPFEQNLLARDDEDGSYQLVNLTPAGVAPEPAIFVAASADLNVVIFSERAKLTPEAVSGVVNFYEWREGVVHLLKLELPSGASVDGTVVKLSADGSDLFFTANGNLYVRVDGERTVQLDEARGGSGSGGGGELAAVSADGTQVLFTDDAASGLTGDTVAGSGTNLYRYDTSTGQLSDLTPVDNANAKLKGMGEDGSYVYFTSEGVQSGSQANQLGETAQTGQPNLYLDHEGTITFVIDAKLMATPGYKAETYALAQNGAFFAFNATSSLTGYDNNGYSEIYLYSAAANRFECASCNPSGEAPTNTSANVIDKGVVLGSGYVRHQVSDDGQVFFDANEALLPRDTNGQFDVYEFDFNGGLHLISPGVGSGPSVLLDASVSGSDVFFLTPQSLVPQDSFQEARKIYDARVDGGFPETALPPACTTADACRSAATPPPGIFGEPSSQTFSGPGNLVPSVKAAVKPRSLTRGQKLTRALNTCHREKNRRKRATCERQARKRYGAKASGSKRSGKTNTSKRGGK